MEKYRNTFNPYYVEINRTRIVDGEIRFISKGKKVSVEYKYNLDQDMLILSSGKDTKDDDWISLKSLIVEYIEKESKRWLLS